jgi:hypothetical protein
MNFDIRPDASMRDEYNIIRMPQHLREELGVILGQFLQLRGSKEELVLQIWSSSDFPEGESVAYVNPENFEKLKGVEVEFEILEVTLGCDPEFHILYRNQLISAATYLPYAGQIGCDGTLGELRPRYGKHESQVVANLRHLIPQIPSRMKRSRWARNLPPDGREFRLEAHSYYAQLCAGFHIHLGIPPEILNTRKDFNRAAMNHIVQCLDWYVSVPLVPLEVSHQRRIGGSQYGRPGDYRPSNRTLEYRVPGAFYLRSPALAEGLLGLSLLVTENVVSQLKTASQDFLKLHRMTKADLQEAMPIPEPDEIRGTVLAPDVRVAQKQLAGIQKQLASLASYKKHQEGIERFLRIVETRERPRADILHNWKEQS